MTPTEEELDAGRQQPPDDDDSAVVHLSVALSPVAFGVFMLLVLMLLVFAAWIGLR